MLHVAPGLRLPGSEQCRTGQHRAPIDLLATSLGGKATPCCPRLDSQAPFSRENCVVGTGRGGVRGCSDPLPCSPLCPAQEDFLAHASFSFSFQDPGDALKLQVAQNARIPHSLLGTGEMSTMCCLYKSQWFPPFGAEGRNHWLTPRLPSQLEQQPCTWDVDTDRNLALALNHSM